jgi:hypothetical protein
MFILYKGQAWLYNDEIVVWMCVRYLLPDFHTKYKMTITVLIVEKQQRQTMLRLICQRETVLETITGQK